GGQKTEVIMPKLVSRLVVIVALFSLLPGLTPLAAQVDPATRPTHVIVISLDGTRPDAIRLAETPHLDSLVARGAVSWTAQTVYPPSTLPSHTSMLTGLDVPEHGRTWNDNLERRPVLEIPTILPLAHDAGFRTALVSGKEIFRQLNQPGVDDYTFVTDGDPGVARRTVELLRDGFQVIVAHFPNPDYIGHLDGWMSESYLYELRNTDANVGVILDEVDALGLTDETLIIITADHGGHGLGHGERIPEDMTIPWIVAGPGVVPGLEIAAPVHTTDTAATVLWALGLPVPPRAAGRPVTAAFTRETRQAWPVIVATPRALSDAAWSPDGSLLAVAGRRGVQLYDRDLRVVGELDGAERVYAVTWSPDGEQLATGGADAVIRIWDRSAEGAGFTLSRLIFTEHEWIKSVSWSPDGGRLAAIGGDDDPEIYGPLDMLHIWTTDDWTAQQPLPGPMPTMLQVLDWSPDGRLLASAGVFDHRTMNCGEYCEAGGTHFILDVSTGEIESVFGETVIEPLGGGFSWSGMAWYQGEWAATAGYALRIYNTTGNPPELAQQQEAPFLSGAVEWSPDGRLLALSNLRTLTLLNPWEGIILADNFDGGFLAWSPDGDLLAVINGAGAIQLHDVSGLIIGP
ncbi:MAG: alkaline phosphatase family protein, partial [Anaerolineae bacterium]|nr:alkaline phosphatase family protein [Anaerolineae bacterium]